MPRTNQMERTRSAIVAAAREIAESGAEITMPAVAAEARVSEATAYRYFPDLVSLLRAAVTADDQLAALQAATEGVTDPVERAGRAAEILGRAVLRRQGAVRAVVAASIARPSAAAERPVRRFALIEHALAPWAATHDGEQLARDLAVVISAESMFTLTDLCRLSPDEAIASLVATARRVTAAAVRAGSGDPAHSTIT
ncbi:TetR family transcriptional regulator [Actinoplanes sp. NPDC051851]|uniref:TetR family transcriptional regulator n=1 Tax=Actinoplanes sp. NPDC051851 TaxID=3154753 RepID=UPI0034499852